VSNPSRISRRFAALQAEGRGGLVTFLTAGDPDAATSAQLLAALPAAGADLIELGMPFTDPMADGPAIQASSLRALKAGQTMRRTLAMVSEFRAQDDQTPIVLMGYYNPVYVYGVDAFVADASRAGADGLIIVDLPPEEADELRLPAAAAGLDVIFLTAPTTDDVRLPTVVAHARGFIYYVSITGVTGTRSATRADVERSVGRIRAATDLPVAIGFGITSPDQAAAMACVGDAAVVGSALVKKVTDNLDGEGRPAPGLVAAVTGFVAELAEGVRTGSRRETAA
jgi:tryptophan synthase, alpha subunit